ncbi:DNA excision repair protein Rad2 [Histoplasma capsulatum G186AR]|uniref:DNA excision repair protein Rad2 n=2 Tax=Ajellomyces capsulatus TaxID=5037 RepID=C0NQJ7_AJECG|nr:DNA excision repair protein Rad2 [Histoplasma capsulatum G186AR]EEH06469.1 DNA excision repair protein Rad2 [Histoplasma capsulatum G186AR]KAG5293069.1 DNA excision repair protein Rad2 [Histoplasma capsulatum]QSS74521.1 DNA excision repair protein Rad2 [Histoplasma capsulatum G186AR]
MGVTGLWTVVKPCARPIKIETLNRKRLAVDASIWIYQFLKAVRDKEGNALRNAHIVGFFQRICKLLYFGIKPVFVFDGGAPTLKRQTIMSRKQRREGKRENAARTAGKILAVQIQRKAEEEIETQRRMRANNLEPEEPLPDHFVYVDELNMTPEERQKNRQFRKQDAYHLPELDVSLAEMGAPNDPRIMSHEELEEYARQFHSGEDISLYDFSKIDFNSPFFVNLPPSDRYNILNAARLRSRLRMGYSKEQLDNMFPDRMAFSRFQIERVKERNDLTQRLMHLSGMTDDDSLYEIGGNSRIAGERGKEYVLVKNSGVEGGWALGVLGNKDEGQRNKPIDVEEYGEHLLSDDHNALENEDEDFEDVPIEGLNRMPKLPVFDRGVFDKKFGEHSRKVTDHRTKEVVDKSLDQTNSGKDSLFVLEEPSRSTIDHGTLHKYSRFQDTSDNDDLLRAIQMSLETGNDQAVLQLDVSSSSDKNQEISRVAIGEEDVSDIADDEDMNFFAALSKSKAMNIKPNASISNPFDGPLPFEPLKIRKPTSWDKVINVAGPSEEPTSNGQRIPQALPPWFDVKLTEKTLLNQDPGNEVDGVDPTSDARRCDNTPKEGEMINFDVGVARGIEINELETTGRDNQAHRVPIQSNASNCRTCHPPVSSREPLANTFSSTQEHTEPEGTAEQGADNRGSVENNGEAYEWEPTYHKGVQNEKSNSKMKTQEAILPPSPDFEDAKIYCPSEALQTAPHMYNSSDDTSRHNNFTHYDHDSDDFSDPEDDELIHQLQKEAEEHARFASTLNSKSQAENAFNYEQELKQLRSQQKKARRDADEVSHIMISECQELLRLFGLPYITAPMEAEAQCAELLSLGLVDGVVTDDSDIFLFGGTRVYKNMFNQAKFVECYISNDLEKEYNLDRNKLIQFAHLLGSDYTEGIPGVGPVSALEILTEFPTLEDFRDWWSQVQMGAKLPEDSHSIFRKKFKKNVTKLFLPPGFPDKRVDTAYLEPKVDSDPSAFQWGVPDLNALRQFLMSTIGWSQERTDEVLVPVIRDMNRREQEGTQSNITNFFQGPQGAGAFAPHRRPDGKSRMEKAFSRLRHQAQTKQRGSGPVPDEDKAPNPSGSKPSTNRKSGKRSPDNGYPTSNDREITGDNKSDTAHKTSKKQKTTKRQR